MQKKETAVLLCLYLSFPMSRLLEKTELLLTISHYPLKQGIFYRLSAHLEAERAHYSGCAATSSVPLKERFTFTGKI